MHCRLGYRESSDLGHMNSGAVDSWSDLEIAIARFAHAKAARVSTERLISAVKEKASMLSDIDTLWDLNDFLSAERYRAEGMSDFNINGILFVFAEFLKYELIQLGDLQGLSDDKVAKVVAMSKF